MAPRRAADELFDPLVIAPGNIVADRLHILAALGSYQPCQIVARVLHAVHPLADKMVAIVFAELHERPRQTSEGAGFIFF